MANVDLKSLFTSEKQYTVLQLLNVLIDEVGKSMVKTATINQDVDAGTLTLTITLSDDSVVTASTDLKSLTDTEKSLISTLTTNVNATNEGVTFLKVVGFEGNETHKGNEIHQGYESHLGDESHSGTATYKGVIKASEIDNTAGNAMLRNKDTEGAIVLGSVSKKAVIMGSGDRPTYSKDGSDFAGSELALKSDVEDIQTDKWNSLYYNLGYGRWAHQQFVNIGSSASVIYDPLLKKYGNNYIRTFAFVTFSGAEWGTKSDWTFSSDTKWSKTDVPIGTWEGQYFSCCFYGAGNSGYGITIPGDNIASRTTLNGASCEGMFAHSKFKFIKVRDGEKFYVIFAHYMFVACSMLEEISGFVFYSRGTFDTLAMFDGCTKLAKITNCTLPNYSFNLSASTAFTEEALVEILNQLPVVSSTQTLTLGTTNVNKLTADEITIATGKGWALA